MEPSEKRDLHEAMSRSDGGFTLALGPVFFALAGLWLDRRLGTEPVIMLVAVVVGIIGCVLKVYYDFRRGMDRADAERVQRVATNRARV